MHGSKISCAGGTLGCESVNSVRSDPCKGSDARRGDGVLDRPVVGVWVDSCRAEFNAIATFVGRWVTVQRVTR